VGRWLGLDLSPLRTSREFRLVYLGAGVSMLGSFLTYVSIPYQVFVLTHDPLLVGLLGVCEVVPLLFMAFVGGALADYLDRRRLVLYGELAFAGLTAVLLANALLGRPQLWLLFAVSAVSTAIDGIQRPALEAVVPRLVPPEQIPATSALNSVRMTAASLGGPALAGVLISQVGLASVYAIDLATFAVSLLCLLAMKPVPPPPAPERPSLRSVVSGLGYARRRPELLGTYLVDLNAMFFGMPMALYPFVADRMGGPSVLGLLYAAPAAGGLLVVVSSRWMRRVHRHGLAVILAAAGWGVAVVGFGVAGRLWIALTCLALAGGADEISAMFRGIMWNQTIPDRLRGRLAGVEMLSYSIGPTMGNLESGVAARLVGVGGSIVLGGVLCVAGTITLTAALPTFRRYNGRDGLARKVAEDEAWAAAALKTA
jgi:MFS family permease